MDTPPSRSTPSLLITILFSAKNPHVKRHSSKDSYLYTLTVYLVSQKWLLVISSGEGLSKRISASQIAASFVGRVSAFSWVTQWPGKGHPCPVIAPTLSVTGWVGFHNFLKGQSRRGTEPKLTLSDDFAASEQACSADKPCSPRWEQNQFKRPVLKLQENLLPGPRVEEETLQTRRGSRLGAFWGLWYGSECGLEKFFWSLRLQTLEPESW